MTNKLEVITTLEASTVVAIADHYLRIATQAYKKAWLDVGIISVT